MTVRRRAALAALMASLLLARPALAAPTCEDPTGRTTRCGTAGAMPVGWSLPASARAPEPPLGARRALSLIAVVGGLLALIALLPDFEGEAVDGGWDRQEGDDPDAD